MVPSRDDQGCERAVVGQCIQRVEVGLRRQWQVPERAHRLHPVAYEQQPKAPGLELFRASDLSGEVGILPVRHGLGRVQGNGAHLDSFLSGVLNLFTTYCEVRRCAVDAWAGKSKRVGALA